MSVMDPHGRIGRTRSTWRARATVIALLLGLLSTACSSPIGGGSPGAAILTPSLSAPSSVSSSPVHDWTTFGFNAARSGVNPGETAITPATVERLHVLWRVALPGVVDSSPILLHGLSLPDGSTRDVLYAETRDGRLLALDAASGKVLWSRQPVGPHITHSSPLADPARQIIYAYGLDGYLHRYHATTGEEIVGDGWPVQITRMRDTEKESSALNAAGGHIYVVTSGYIGDAPPYQGHLVTISSADATTHVFNSLCSNLPHLLTVGDCAAQRSGIWARAGTVVDPVTGNVFLATGNGPYSGQPGGPNWGDSVLELSPDGSRLLDSYTPATYQQLDENDTDLGSTAPALLPKITGSKTPYLLVQGGKDGVLRLLNRQNLSGKGQPGHTGGEIQTLPSAGCSVFTQPAVWTDPANGAVWVFVAGVCGTAGYQVLTDTAGVTRLHLAWRINYVATTPVIAGGMLFAATDGSIAALDPHTGRQLWASDQGGVGGTIGPIHWQSPIVVGGRLYCADDKGHLFAYGL